MPFTDQGTVEVAPSGFIHKVSALHKKIDVYSFSYLGLGLMAARKHILMTGNAEGSSTLKSPCINPMIKKGWSYSGVTYIITGMHEVDVEAIPLDQWQKKDGVPAADYDSCLKHAKSLIEHSVHKPEELNVRDVMAISYYFDRATDHGLIDAAEGGSISVKQLFKAAQEICSVPNPDQAFACLDMTYIASLLHHGFGLKEETVLQVNYSFLLIFVDSSFSRISINFFFFQSFLLSFLDEEKNRRLRDELGAGCRVSYSQ